MKYVRLTCLWVAALFGISLGASAIAGFGLSPEKRLRDSMIYPAFRFYRGSGYATVTEATLARIFEDRLTGVARTPETAKRLAKHLHRLCRRHRIDPALVLSMIQVESSFRANAVSPVGAVGLMQLMPATARSLTSRRITRETLMDPFLNLELGVVYLRDLRKRYTGLSAYYPLAAYNLGPYRLDRLRASPTFRPDKTLKYYEDIMRGVGEWRRYGSRVLSEGSTIPRGRSALKTKPDEKLPAQPLNPA